MIERWKNGLIVSCQADPGDPLFGPVHMVAMARAAKGGGAVAIRANGPDDVAAIKQAVPLPVIGLFKRRYEGSAIYITPTLAEVRAMAAAGADVLALQLTSGPRPGGLSNEEFVALVRQEFPGLPLMADIATVEEGLAAARMGVDLLSTTMSGYTPDSPQLDGPDLGLVGDLARRLSVPVVAEGRIRTPEEARQALQAGAHAVVVGTAITRPQTVTGWFAAAMKGSAP